MNTPDHMLEEAIELFHRILCLAWEQVMVLASSTAREPAEMSADWAQANWEMLVEASVSPAGEVFIDPYGEGADCNRIGSRVWMPGVASTHIVSVIAVGDHIADVLSGQNIDIPEGGLPFDRFVARVDDWYAERPPFDHVLTWASGKERLFRREEVRFRLRPASPRS